MTEMNDAEESQYFEESDDDFDSPDELVNLCVIYNLTEAEKIISFLETKGFQVVVTDCDNFEISDLAAHIDKGVNLNVFSEDHYDATMWLSDFHAEQVLAGEIEIDNGWGNCPECQSKNLTIEDDVAVEMTPLTYLKTFFIPKRNLHCYDCEYEWITEKE